VVIGGLFTSTLLTLILVPVLYSIASRFTGARSTRDLDELFDAAQERRFKPIGGRGSVLAPAPAVDPFSVSVLIEPEPGTTGDRGVLERLAGSGYTIAPVPGSAKVRVTIPGVEAESESGAKDVAMSKVKELLPPEGYVVSNPEATAGEHPMPEAMAQIPA